MNVVFEGKQSWKQIGYNVVKWLQLVNEISKQEMVMQCCGCWQEDWQIGEEEGDMIEIEVKMKNEMIVGGRWCVEWNEGLEMQLEVKNVHLQWKEN